LIVPDGAIHDRCQPRLPDHRRVAGDVHLEQDPSGHRRDSGFAFLVALGIVTATDVLRGLGDSVAILIAALFVMGAGLEASGVTTWAGQQLGQRGGGFGDLSQIAADHKANVIDIHPSRTFTSAAHRDKEIELLAELRGPEVAVKILEAIKAKGYEVTQHAAA
jgi:hypothetical protein